MSDEMDREEGAEEEELEEVAAPRRTAKSKKTLAAPPPANVGGNAGNMMGRARTKEDGTPNSKWQSHEAELMWPEMLGYLEGVGKSPYDVEAHIVRVDPPGPNGATGLGSIDGQALIGNSQISAGDKLMQVVTDTKHMPTARGPARYEVRFVWKVGSGRIGTGILNLPSPGEIMALRNAAMQAQYEAAQQQPPPGAGAPQQQRHPQPPQQQWPTQPWPSMPMHPMPPWGYGAMPPSYYGQQPQGLSPEMAALQSQLERTQGALNEALAAAREGRQPRIEGVAAPPPPSEEAIAEKVTARVLMALQKVGVLGAPPAQPAAPPPATPAETRGMMDEMFNGVMRTALGVFRSGLEKSVKTAFGMGEVPEEATAEIAEPEPAKDEFKTPFDVAAVEDVKWPDGSPVRYAADRKTGDISPMGLAFGNPYIVEKGIAVAEGLTGALTDVLKGLARPPAGAGSPPPQVAPPQVVREIPQGAVDASTSASEVDEKNNGFPSI